MTATRHSVMWPLIIIAIGSVWLLMVAGVFPSAVEDVLLRAWPALFVLFGFDVLLGRRRVRLARWAIDSSYIGLTLTLVLLAAMVVFAYRKQATVIRTDNVQTFSKVLPDSVERLQLLVDVERTDVSFAPSEEYERELGIVFQGSNESDVQMIWELADDTGKLTLDESYRSRIPPLEDYGRGTLEIRLPIGVSVDVLDVRLASGDAALNLEAANVPSLALTVETGDVMLVLPVANVLAGDMRVSDGDVEVRVPVANTLNIKAQGRSSPEMRFDRDRYDLLVGGELKNKSAESFDYSLNVWMSGSATLTITDVP